MRLAGLLTKVAVKIAYALALTLLLLPSTSFAQAAPCRKALCAPTFALQPGIAVFNAIDAPVVNAAGDRAERSVQLLARMATTIPTGLPRTSLVAVVWWTPLMTTEVVNAAGARVKMANNAPNFLMGPSFLLLTGPAGALQFSILDGYRRWEKPNEDGKIESYRHNLMLIPSVALRVGAALPQNAPALLRSVSMFAIWQQQLTNMPFDVGPDGKPTDQRAYPPGLFFGFTVPIAPTP